MPRNSRDIIASAIQAGRYSGKMFPATNPQDFADADRIIAAIPVLQPLPEGEDDFEELLQRADEYATPAQYSPKDTPNYVLVRGLATAVRKLRSERPPYVYGAKGTYRTPQVNSSLESAEYNAREHSQPVYRRRAAGLWEIAPEAHNYETNPKDD